MGSSVLFKTLHRGFEQYVPIAGVLARRAVGAGVARVQRGVGNWMFGGLALDAWLLTLASSAQSYFLWRYMH